MKQLKYFLILLGVSGLIYWSFTTGQKVPFKEQWPLFEALRATAAIIFAVVGAWLAIIYPEQLKLAFLPKSEIKQKSSTVGLYEVLSPAIHSTVILAIILLIGVIAPLARHSAFLLEYKECLRGVSYSTLSLLTLWQLGTILFTFRAPDKTMRAADIQDVHTKTTADYLRNAKVSPRKK